MQKGKKCQNREKHYTNNKFLQNSKKMEKEIFAFCVITFELIKIWTCSAPQNDSMNFSFVKNIKIVAFVDSCQKKRPEMVEKRQLELAGRWRRLL